jgi:hypothetical protein
MGCTSGGEEAFDLWRGRCAQIWLRALVLYETFSNQLGWSEAVVSPERKAMMQKEFDDFLKSRAPA